MEIAVNPILFFKESFVCLEDVSIAGVFGDGSVAFVAVVVPSLLDKLSFEFLFINFLILKANLDEHFNTL
jgi:hypothetical protein